MPYGDEEALAAALVRVISDKALQKDAGRRYPQCAPLLRYRDSRALGKLVTAQ